MTWDRVERLLGKPNLEKLAGMRVAVIGLGSGGGFVALSLAMSGVGHFTLIDDDTLEDSNIPRHVADRRYLGMPKVDALADLIRQRNPAAEVTTHVGRLENHLDALDSAHLVVSGLDGENAKYTLNQACLDRNLIASYAGVYERGEGGDAVIIRPYDGPCYACWASELREGMSAASARADAEADAEGDVEGDVESNVAADFANDRGMDYGMIGKDGTLEAEPGLWLHVVRIASAQADMILNELLHGTTAYRPPPANTVIMANTALEIIDGQTTPPYGAVWVEIERAPDCLVCGDAVRRAKRLSVEGNETDAPAGLSLDDLMAESGLTVETEAGDG